MTRNKLFLFIISGLIIIFSGCKPTIVLDETVTFPDSNWAFENKILTFNATIEAIDKPYEILLELDVTGTPQIEKLSTTFGVLTPKGAQTYIPVVFYFNSPKTPFSIDKTTNRKIYKQVAYSKKYFNEVGIYTFEINQFSNKADNYGFNSLRIIVKKTKV